MTDTFKPRIGPWTALALIIAFFAVMEVVLPMARAAITPHLTTVRHMRHGCASCAW